MGGAPTARLRILVVDDNADDVELMINRLADRPGWACEVTTAATLADAISDLCRLPFDLALVDLNLPDEKGLFTLERLKQACPELPVVVITGALERDLRQRCLSAGAEEAISKHEITSQLFSLAVLYVVERKRAERERSVAEERARFLEAFLEQAPVRALAMNTLAAGIVHEINNPLAALIANLDMMGHDLKAWAARNPLPSDVADELERARTSADRVRRAVGDLRIFSATENDRLELIDVERVLDSALRMTSNEIRHRAKLVKNYGRVPPILANEARLGQVFLNLLVNAARSLPDGNYAQHHVVVTTVLEKDGRIAVTIADTGNGLAPEVKARIFVPSFSTEDIGAGRIGLAICHRIVTSLGGELVFESGIGHGNEFRAVFPAAKLDEDELGGNAPPSIERRGRILVIDDEPQMLHAVKRMIADKHDVSTWTEAEGALGLLKTGERFDAILCDLMMPQMTGRDFYGEVVKLDPAQAKRMVFMTAGAFTPHAREFLDSVENARLEKPFDRMVLRTLLHGLVRS